MKVGGVSIADHIFADVTDVSGQDNLNACEGMSSIFFEQRTLKSRGDYERKALWSRECVSRTLVFYLVSACVSHYLFSFVHRAQLMIDSRSHDTAFRQGLAQGSSQQERVSASSACSIVSCCFVCSGLRVRYTDVFNMFLSIPFLVWTM